MARINELLQQVPDQELRSRLEEEIERINKNKKFGLVFEEHIPECTPLYGIGVKSGISVARRTEQIKEVFTVVSMDGDKARCYNKITGKTDVISIADLVPVAKFGEPIFPMLQPVDAIQNAPDSSLWHTLIESDNYHALQLLEYLYTGKVDCIYIDPPYNTGAKDWKYNNDYVDGSDSYRHSKWLSMMEKRIRIAKRLLNPSTGVLICTIDEKEVHHLRTLLEELMPEMYIQMVSIVINPKGSTRGRFSRVEEYALFCFMPDAYVQGGADSMLGEQIEESEHVQPRWKGLLRSGIGSARSDSPNLFYPILIDEVNNRIVRAEIAVPLGITPDYDTKIEGYSVAWPVRNDGSEGRWMLSTETFNDMLEKGYVSLGAYDRRRKTWGFSYLSKKYQTQIETGELIIVGKSENGQSVVVEYAGTQDKQIKTIWHRTRHDAGAYGSDLVSAIIGKQKFTFPKSLYAVKDCLSSVIGKTTDALVVDFFAGSGTTLHAVNLLNAEDGGHRRCILVTNNEVSADEAKGLTKRGLQPGDPEWEQYGVARYVTWPRTVCSIEGHDISGAPLRGSYIESDRPMADGFAANAEYFKLGFLDKDSVTLGRQFKEILPLLWLKTGAVGKRPECDEQEPEMMILPENEFAILVDEMCYARFIRELSGHDEIKTVFFVTDSEDAYREMSAGVGDRKTHHLYREYIDNFVIGSRRV